MREVSNGLRSASGRAKIAKDIAKMIKQPAGEGPGTRNRRRMGEANEQVISRDSSLIRACLPSCFAPQASVTRGQPCQ
jgi:hypothetical protein